MSTPKIPTFVKFMINSSKVLHSFSKNTLGRIRLLSNSPIINTLFKIYKETHKSLIQENIMYIKLYTDSKIFDKNMYFSLPIIIS